MPASAWRGGVSSARAARCVWSSQGNHKTVAHAQRQRTCPGGSARRRTPGRRGRSACRCPRWPAHPDAEAITIPGHLNVIRQPGDDSEAELGRERRRILPIGSGLRRPCHAAVADGGVGHHNLEPLPGTGQGNPDRFGRAVLLMHLDSAGACLAHGEADLVEQGFRDAAAPRHGRGHQPCRAHMRRQRRERHLHGRHRLRWCGVTSPTSGRRWPRPRRHGCRRPWSGR